MPSAKNKILIAEDERPLAKALKLKLSKLGYDCDVAFDGEEALIKLSQRKYHLLIADIMMPKRNGFDVIENMPELNKGIATIIASNLAQSDDKARANAAGVKKYFVKADTPLSVLVGYIEEILNAPISR